MKNYYCVLKLVSFIASEGQCPPNYISGQNLSTQASFCYPKYFRPSSEYQVVRENQILPKGLHVKIDLTTGLKLAKLDTNNKKNELIEFEPTNKQVPIDFGRMQVKHSKNAKFNQLVERFLKAKDEVEKAVELLDLIEEKVHDQDYGAIFAEQIVEKKLLALIAPGNPGNIHTNVKSKLIEAMGSSVQNSPITQNILINDQSIEGLLTFLKDENNKVILTKYLYFLSGMLRNNYDGIEKYHKLKGSTILMNVFNKHSDSDSDRISTKIVNLISDTHSPEMIDTTNFKLESQSVLETSEVFQWCNKLTEITPKHESIGLDKQTKTAMLECINTLFINFEHYCTLDVHFIDWAQKEKKYLESMLKENKDQNDEYYNAILSLLTTQQQTIKNS